MRTCSLFVLALAWAPLLGAHAQVQTAHPARLTGASLSVQHLDERDGLADAAVRYGLLFDELGFLWIGSETGLNRYDGSRVHTYRPVPFDTTTLTAGVFDLARTTDGALWVSTFLYLHRYDTTRDAMQRVHSVPQELNFLYADPDGSLWATTIRDGTFRVNPQTLEARSYRLFPVDSLTPHRNIVDAMIRTDDGALWMSTGEDGIHRLSADQVEGAASVTGRSTPVGHADASGRRVEDRIPVTDAFVVRRDGSLWSGGSAGLLRYDPDRDAFVQVAQWADIEPTDGYSSVSHVRALLEDPSGGLWIGSDEGLHRLSSARPGEPERLESYPHVASDPSSMPDGPIHSLALNPSTGIVAAGMSESGVALFTWHAPPITHLGPRSSPVWLPSPNIWGVHADPDGTIWAGSYASGPYRISPDRQRVDSVAQYNDHTAADFYRDRQGTLWTGIVGEGVFTVDEQAMTLTSRFAPDREDPSGLFAMVPWRFHEDRKGRFWMVSGLGEGCLSELHRDTGTVTRYCHDPDAPGTSPGFDVARALVEDADGVLWLGTWRAGLDRFDPDTGTFEHFSHDPLDRSTVAGDYVSDLAIGPDGALWLSYLGSGLSRFDPQTRAFEHLLASSSTLPTNDVISLRFDAEGMLWMATDKGIVRLDPADRSVRVFGRESGAQLPPFRTSAAFVGSDGRIYFGGVEGLSIIDPSAIEDAPASHLVITRVDVDGEDRTGEDEGAAVSASRSVRLGADERAATIGFAAVRVGAPGARYRYRMSRLNDEWTTTTDQSVAYTNLPPGEHVFEVQAARPGEGWDETGSAIATLAVTPRFFETLWFRALVMLTLIALAIYMYRYRVAQVRRREVVLEQTVAERTSELRAAKRTTDEQAARLIELDRTKSRFFTNVSHEFRTPLTLAIGPLEDLERDPSLNPSARGYVDLALRNSRRLLRLIGQLLDVAKLDAGALRLDTAPVDLCAFARDCATPFVPFAERRRLRFDVEAPPGPIWAEVDADKLEQVVVNLLSNAFKFTPEGGTIRLELRTDDARGDGSVDARSRALLTIRDSGPGIAPDELPRLFDRFYQSDATATDVQAGSGIGLSLARDLAELHGGTLTAESTPGLGAAFTLTLPTLANAADAVPHVRTLATASPDPVARGDADPVDLSGEAEPDDERPTVLVVDDHADIRAYVRGHLAADYRVVEARDGEQALALARETPPDLIVSDVMMPRMDGFALVRALKSDPATDFIPILLLTAKATADEKLEGLGVGADDYLTKPFDVRELCVRIANRIASRKRLRERMSTWAAAPLAQPLEGDFSASDSAFLEQVARVVHEQMSDEDFAVDTLAESVDTSRSTLHRRLGDLLGVTPSAYLRSARLGHARSLLAAREGTIGEVAYAVGFKSVSHFSQSFRKHTGMTPTDFLSRNAKVLETDSTTN